MRIPEAASGPDPVHNNDWEPKPGDTLAGLVNARESFTSKRFGGEFDVLVVRNGDGDETRAPCARSHLAQLVADHDPQPGDGIAITYFGQEEGEFGRHLYAMRVNKAEGESDDTPF